MDGRSWTEVLVRQRGVECSPVVARRTALGAAAFAAAALATGCGADLKRGIGALGTPPTPLPDVAVLRAAIAGERRLVARYRAVLARLPGLRGALAPILAEHQQHLAAMSARLVDPRASESSPPRTTPPAPPAAAAEAVDWLREAERAAATALLAHLGAAPPSLAQLMASIAASETTHAAVLGARGSVA